MLFWASCFLLALFVKADATNAPPGPKQLIVVSLPDDQYYQESFNNSLAFVRQMADGSFGLDDFVVLYSRVLAERYGPNLPIGENTPRLIVDESLDLWMRDFGLVLPKQQIKLGYKPKYLKDDHAKYVDGEFRKLLGKLGVKVVESNIIIDGGNVVDNNKNIAILSERILEENPGRTKPDLKPELENLFAAAVIFIPDPKDTTGHSDGIVSFIEENVLLIGDYNDPEYYQAVEQAVKTDFPNMNTVKLGCDKQGGAGLGVKRLWRGFSSAVGSYVNILVTNNAVYVPQFDIAGCDQQALEIIRANTKKAVVPINTAKLSHMGGSVRCMSWQMESEHPVAQALAKAIQDSMQMPPPNGKQNPAENNEQMPPQSGVQNPGESNVQMPPQNGVGENNLQMPPQNGVQNPGESNVQMPPQNGGKNLI